jgi:molecular chaperone DnaK
MSTRSDPPVPLLVIDPVPVLVIDLGNTSTSAALVSGDRSRLLAEPISGALIWPSVVFWDGQQMLVGTLAQHHRQLDPAGFGVDIKRGLGEDASVQLGTHTFRAAEQVAALLTALRLEAERVQGGPVARALITAPAAYGPGDQRRTWLVAAAEAAGFTAVELLAEPVAIAHAPVVGPGMHPGDLVLVYDLGGGTFDAALVRLGGRVPEILGHASVDDCGGRDIDNLLSQRITDAGKEWLDSLVGTATDDGETALRLSMAVTEFAQQIKHQLSDTPTVEDYLLPTAPPYQLDQQELATLAAPVLARTVACCRQLLARLDVPVPGVATILLVGGGTRMPAVVDLLAREFGRAMHRVEDPELATVRGAVRWLEHSAPRLVMPLDRAGRAVPLAFTLPGGTARLLRWLVRPGQAYNAGQVLGRVRLTGGALWDLAAAADGSLERVLVQPGGDVATGQWLAVSCRR